MVVLLGAVMTLRRLRSRYALLWHVISVAVGFMVSAALVIVDPLNLDQGLTERSHDLFYKVAAFAYPTKSSPPTLVVTINDDFLKKRSLAWPMSYRAHSVILDEIASRGPKAIFIDMAFIDRRDDAAFDGLIEQIGRISDKIPVYIAAAPAIQDAPLDLPEIRALAATKSGVKLVSITSKDDAPLSRTYPINQRRGPEPAAVQIYKDLYDPRFEPRSRDDKIDLWWAAPRDEFNCRGAEPPLACEKLDQPVALRTLDVLMAGVLPTQAGSPDPTLAPIPYAPTINAGDLFVGDATAAIAPKIGGAVVFYGADLILTGDLQSNPVQGWIPGVQVHAMALDNLAALKGAYISALPPFGMDPKLHTLMVLLLVSALMLAARCGLTLAIPDLGLQPHLRGSLFGLVDGAVLACGILVIVTFEFVILKVGPNAWATVLIAAISGDVLTTRYLTGTIAMVVLKRQRTAWRAVRKKRRWRR